MSTTPEADPELETVFDTQQESEAMVVHSLLSAAGIESLVSTLEAPQDILPGVGGVVVRVNRAQADEARSIIEDYKNTPEAVVEEAEEAGEAEGSEPPPE